MMNEALRSMLKMHDGVLRGETKRMIAFLWLGYRYTHGWRTSWLAGRLAFSGIGMSTTTHIQESQLPSHDHIDRGKHTHTHPFSFLISRPSYMILTPTILQAGLAWEERVDTYCHTAIDGEVRVRVCDCDGIWYGMVE